MNDTLPEANVPDPATPAAREATTPPAEPKKEEKGSALWREIKGLLWVLRHMNVQATCHGFRSSFRDWCGNETNFAREPVEHCLAHRIGNSVEQAYRRQDALDKRRVIMNAWADYCGGGRHVIAQAA